MEGGLSVSYDCAMSKSKLFFSGFSLSCASIAAGELTTFPPLGGTTQSPVRSWLGCGSGCG